MDWLNTQGVHNLLPSVSWYWLQPPTNLKNKIYGIDNEWMDGLYPLALPGNVDWNFFKSVMSHQR